MANCEKCRYHIGCVNYEPKSTTACEHYAEDERNVLKPCPFCGSEAKVYQDYTSHYLIQCTKCGIGTLHYGDKQTPKDVWNRRADNERKTD